MPLTPDQRAMLQLLLERDQGYDELAALLGVKRDEVGARARAALIELGGVDPDRNVGLTDYLLGQADPIGRADASRHLREHADDRALATTLVERLRELYPDARLPRLPGEPRPKRRPGRAAEGRTRDDGGRRRSRPSGALSRGQARLLVILGSAAVLVVVVVLAVTGVFGGEDSQATSAGQAATTANATDERIQSVALRPPDGGGDARGEATFGLATGDQPFMDLSIEELNPAPRGQTYVIWMMLQRDQGYPLSPFAVSPQGSFDDRFPIPAAVLPVVARIRSVEVAIAPVKEVRKTVRSAIRKTELVLDRPGETVLRGEIPRARSQGSGQGSGSGAG